MDLHSLKASTLLPWAVLAAASAALALDSSVAGATGNLAHADVASKAAARTNVIFMVMTFETVRQWNVLQAEAGLDGVLTTTAGPDSLRCAGIFPALMSSYHNSWCSLAQPSST